MGRGFESGNEHLHLDEIEEAIHDPSVVMINRQSRHLKVCIWSELGKDDVKEEKHNAFVLPTVAHECSQNFFLICSFCITMLQV